MKIINIHEREFRASPPQLGALIDSLASPNDALWPKHSWPPMKFDRPLGVGARGGHGPIAYVVEHYVSGHSIRFRFTQPIGFNGYHSFELLPSSAPDRVLLRHTIHAKLEGRALLTWLLAIRSLHDALLEDALATAESSLGLKPRMQAWSPWVRFLRWAMSGGRSPKQRRPSTAQ
jgi:hypothetical protein